MTRRVGAALPPEVEKDLNFLKTKGYSDSEIIREGIRRFAEDKRREAVTA